MHYILTTVAASPLFIIPPVHTYSLFRQVHVDNEEHEAPGTLLLPPDQGVHPTWRKQEPDNINYMYIPGRILQVQKMFTTHAYQGVIKIYLSSASRKSI